MRCLLGAVALVEWVHLPASCNRPRTVAAKGQWHCDELFPRVGFVVTNMRGRAKAIPDFYNGRGRAGQAKVALD